MVGESMAPQNLTLEFLDSYASPIGEKLASNEVFGNMQAAATKWLPGMLNKRHHMGAAWRFVVSSQFLEPFGLSDEDCFMAADDAAEDRIKADNPDLKDFCFHKPVADRPKVYIIGATFLSETGSRHPDAASFQISPDWIGTPFYVNVSYRSPEPWTDHVAHYAATNASGGLNKQVVGGGFVETFAFGAKAPEHQRAGALAMTTYADWGPNSDFSPNYWYWPIGEGRQEERRMMFGDGGFLDDTSLLPMLQRQAARVAVFMFGGPETAVSLDTDWCSSKEELFEVACELSKLKRQGKGSVYKRKQQVLRN